jgi:hypothetical protein
VHRAREHLVKVDRTFVVQTRLQAGQTQALSSGIAGTLVRILALYSARVIQEAGLTKTRPEDGRTDLIELREGSEFRMESTI